MRASPFILATLLFAAPTTVHAGDVDVDTKALQETVKRFKEKNSATKKLFKSAYGYAVYPDVKRGAIGIGGAYGEGGVYRRGKLVAATTLTQINIGLGLGGEAYSEVIFFQNKAAFDRFAQGKIELGARANAAAGTQGASAELGYQDGVAIFTLTSAGLMADASVGGQKFTYTKL